MWLQFQIPLNYDAYVICFLVIIPDLFSCFKLHARKFISHSVGQLISLSVGWLVSQPVTSLFDELSGQTASSTCITTPAHYAVPKIFDLLPNILAPPSEVEVSHEKYTQKI